MADNTDHNDVANKRGLQTVKKSVSTAIDAAKGLAFGAFLIMAGGVFWKKNKDEEAVFFCSYLKPLAICRDSKGLNASILFEMKNLDNAVVQFLLRVEDTQAGGGELARIAFVIRGGYFGTGLRARQLFGDFINSILRHAKALPRITLADRTGWYWQGKKGSYVLPDTTIGPTAEKIILAQSLTAEATGFEVSGTPAEWHHNIGKYCLENSRLILAVCIALSGPLLVILNREGGGFHIVGTSSEGKTTALRLAASVMGDPTTTVKTFDATANAIEGAAALANDATLVNDEIGQADPSTIGGIIYKVTSGIGRGRADQRGEARTRKNWRVQLLTSGETDLETMLRGIGKRPAAGQSLRLANVQASPENGHGIYETLHDFPTGAALSDHIRQAASQYHGSLFRAFLEKLTADLNSDPDGLRQLLQSLVKNFVQQVAPPGSDGQVIRVATRFGILAAAGEYAADRGVLQWPEGQAQWGVRECFNSWLLRRGGHGPLEVKNLLEQFEAFLHQHGASRFEPMDGDHKGAARPIINRAGFSRPVVIAISGEDAGREYFLLPAGFREAINGFDPRYAAKILAQHGWLTVVEGNVCITKRLPGMGPQRCYHVPARGLES